MSGALIIPAITASGVVDGYVPEAASDLRGWFQPGADAAKTIANRAPSKAPGAVVGNVAYSAGYATLSSALDANGSARLETPISDSASLAFFVLFRSVKAIGTGASTRPGIIGNVGTAPLAGVGTAFGTFLYFGSSSTLTLATRVVDGTATGASINAAIPAGNPLAWRLVLAQIASGVGVTLTDLVTAQTATTADARAHHINPERRFWIGDLPNGTLGGQIDVAGAAFLPRVPSNDEIAAIKMQMLEDAALRGVVVA